ncbi:MAG TPA: pyridoxamine 5'-phosphate oxidase family protein [Acidimicrobiales bacterium]|nr:pyridoxamine 5'-phosphate oxidase family protein [Acidimicrobiales bacterium]HWI05424.1 pyridoxamine 5'-phosphate oxidase family protein [Acidimicrobiales bacterium]
MTGTPPSQGGAGDMPGEPAVERLDLPAGYGSPSERLVWADVRARLEAAPHVWLATVRPDGRPHTVPVDGLWVDGAFWFGGSAETVKHRNLLLDGRASVHAGDGDAAVIVEGTAELVHPGAGTVEGLRAASAEKYGYAPPAGAYAGGVWRLRPSKVMAWTSLPVDATRFRFRRG